MANNPVHADRVRETTTSTGTGTIDLDGAVTGFQTFVAGVGDGEECSYAIIAVDGDGVPTGDWELGFGTVNATPDTLSRSPYASSNAGSAVNFSAGTKQVFATPGSRVFPEVGCKVRRNAAQTISNATLTAVSFDTEDWDPFEMHEGVTNPTRVTIAIPGRYHVIVSASWENFVTGTYRDVMIYKNGSLINIGRVPPMSVGENHSTQEIVECAANDYLEFYVAHDRGGDADIGGTSWYKGGMSVQRLTT